MRLGMVHQFRRKEERLVAIHALVVSTVHAMFDSMCLNVVGTTEQCSAYWTTVLFIWIRMFNEVTLEFSRRIKDLAAEFTLM